MSERTGGHHPGLILKLGAEDLTRVGHCWMRGRLLDGDLVICRAHAGDCFWRYCLVEHDFYLADGRMGYRMIPASEFGAYVLGTPYVYQPTAVETAQLLDHQTIPLEADPSREFRRA